MTENLALRPFADEDIALVAGWLKKPHVAQWYHEPEDWLEELQNRHGTYKWLHHFIVMDGAEAVGFCQYYDCFDAGDMEDWYTAPAARGECYSIDYMLGEESRLGRGLGKAIVRLLTEKIQAAGGKQVVVQPEGENKASCGVLLANGYTFDAAKGYFEKLLG